MQDETRRTPPQGPATPGADMRRVPPPPLLIVTKGWWRRPDETATLEELEAIDRGR